MYHLLFYNQALLQQQQKTIDEMKPMNQKEQLEISSKEEDIDLVAFDLVLQPIIDSCTKDNISAGKNFILQHATNAKKAKIVLQYLLQTWVIRSEYEFLMLINKSQIITDLWRLGINLPQNCI